MRSGGDTRRGSAVLSRGDLVLVQNARKTAGQAGQAVSATNRREIKVSAAGWKPPVFYGRACRPHTTRSVPAKPPPKPVFLLPGQVQGLAGGDNGFRKLPRFRVGGGQRVENIRPPAPTELVRTLGIRDRLGTVSQRRLRAGRPRAKPGCCDLPPSLA